MSGVDYSRTIDGEHCSYEWYCLLFDLRYIDGVPYHANELHRTDERQRELIREKGLWTPANPTGAAAVSANAPHIWTGRPDHAGDFNNVEAVIAGARHRGVTLAQTVMPHEPWHVHPDADELHTYSRHHPRRWLHQGSGAGADIERLQTILKRLGRLPHDWKPGPHHYGEPVQRAVKDFKRDHDLPADVVVGELAWIALERAYRKKK